MNDELKNILDKVSAMYMRYGIKSVTMDDVSRELGISKKTLYQYVCDKNELVAHVVDMEIERLGNCFSNLFQKNLNAIEELFEVQVLVSKMISEQNPSAEYDLRKYYPDMYQKITKVRRERMYTNMLANLVKGKKEGLYRSELDETIISKVQLLRIENIFNNEIFTVEEMQSKKVFQENFIYHIRGIASEKGLEQLNIKLKELELNNKLSEL